jgi:hypothetical protein
MFYPRHSVSPCKEAPVLIFLLSILSADAQAWQVRTNDEGKELRWGRRTIHYQIDAAGSHGLSPNAVDGMVAAATRNWSSAVDTNIGFVHDGQSNGATDPHDNKNTIYFDDQWDHDPSLVGLTFIWSRPDGEIVGFDMALNAQDPDWSTDGTPETNDLLNTVSHELGHALGIDHSPAIEQATMYPSTFPGEVAKRDLAEDDEAAMRYLYDGAMNEPKLAQAGCSTVGLSAQHLGWLLMLPLMARRRS